MGIVKNELDLFPGGTVVNNLPAVKKDHIWSLGQDDPMEEEMATHSSILAWKIPWTEEPGRLQFLRLHVKEAFGTGELFVFFSLSGWD